MITLSNVRKTYGHGEAAVTALDGVSLKLDRHDYVSVMGPSGSGKSTLLHILGAMDTPTSGEVLWDGQAIHKSGQRALEKLRRQRIGFVFQTFNLIPTLTALENVALPLELAGVSRRQQLERAAAALEMVELGSRSGHLPAQLSGGQRQRVAIARALVHKPDLILADEPTGALDTAAGELVMDLLEKANRAGCALVIVTHNPEIALRARRQLQMRDGHMEEKTGRSTGRGA